MSLKQITALCKNRGWTNGRNTRFRPGMVSWNKGRKMRGHPNSVKTQFKKGNEPHNTKHLGHERTNKAGYVEVSVAETNPHTGYPRRYVHKHRWQWERENGPVPDGHCLKCLDGDKTNCDPSNWIAVPRSLLPRLSGRWTEMKYDDAPDELKPALLAIARLEDKARRGRKGRSK